MEKCKKKNLFRVLYIALCFLMLLGGAVTNLPAKLCNNASGTAHLDWWSNDLLIADMMYNQNYDNDKLELHFVFPPTIEKLTGLDNVEWVQSNMFQNRETFAQEDFIMYSSNIVGQRFFYGAVDKVLPVSNGTLLKILYLLNDVVTSVTALLFLLCMEKHAVPGTALFGATVLGLFGLVYNGMARNLYWAEWSMFVPPLALFFVLREKQFQKYTDDKQRLRKVFWTVFVGCAIKQLMYFEFLTSAMISATIPVFIYLIENRRKIGDWMRWYGAMIVGAVFSFAVTFGLKTAMLVADLGVSGAREATVQNMLSRVSGLAKTLDMTAEIYDESTRTATDIGAGAVLGKIGGKTALLFNSSFGLSVSQIMVALLLLTALVVVSYKMQGVTSKSCLLVGTAWYAMLAPLSWYVMAKEHTWLHSTYTLIAWYVPGAFVIATAFACYVIELLHGVKNKGVRGTL